MFSLERLAKLASNIAVGVWQDDKELYKSEESDHYIRIGSITKLFTAAVIQRLINDEKITLQDFAYTYLDFDFPSNITIEHLGSMKSGLPDYTSDSNFSASCIVSPEMEWTPRQLVDIAMKSPMKFKPGEDLMYCNTNYIILGLIIESVTGKTLVEVYGEFIFRPFKLDSTFLPPFEVLPDPCFEGFQYINGEFKNVTCCHPSMAWASGGVVSTLNGLHKFAQELIKGQLLPFDEYFTSTNNYGFGLMKFGEFFGHTGNFPGYNTILLVNPEKNIIIIVLTNLKQTLDGKNPAYEIAKEIIKELDKNI